MSKIPCRKCPGCDLFHSISVLSCVECGRDLIGIPALLVEIEEIPEKFYGEIDVDDAVYVQKCPACGALNFTSSIEEPVKICYNCYKKRVASITRTEYTVNENSNVVSEDSAKKKGSNSVADPQEEKVNISVFDIEKDDDDDDDDDDDLSSWKDTLGNIRQAVGSAPLKKPPVSTEISTAIDEGVPDEDDEDDEDDDDVDWTGILGSKSKPEKSNPVATKKVITLTAIRYGRLSFTIEAKESGLYMLGRSANQSNFLSNDGRVGNEHCYIFFKNGFWYVKDNHSKNGTAVNSRDIGKNGEHILSDGDELKLGHHPDSMAFRITI